jgi:purine-binding chemotaxis protein CheW
MPLEAADGGEGSEADTDRTGAGRRRRAQAEQADQGPEGRRVVPSVQKFLTYNAGMDVATPLVQVSEILPYPADYIPLDNGSAIVKGVFTHRRATVPLLCLSTMLGRVEPVNRATARVLLVDAAGGYVGFIVPALNAIEESIWEEVEKPDEPPTGAGKRLVKVGTAEVGRMLPFVDLTRLAATTA